MGTGHFIDDQLPDKRGRIHRTKLKVDQYTVSLLNEGLHSGMMSVQEISSIQNKLMLVLQNLIWRYTQGDSSSVTTETAENIFASMLYAVDAYVKSLDSPEKALVYLHTTNMESIYEKGVGLVHACFEETKQMYDKLKRNKLDVPVDAYNLTIDESLPVFMKKYGIMFDAHNTMAGIDYPLAIDDMRLQGVYYMRQYIHHLSIETSFCRLFKHEELLGTLINFGRTCRLNYRIELFNIFELVLYNAVFSNLSGGEPGELTISPYQFEQLERTFTQAASEQIDLMIRQAMDRIRHDLHIADPEMGAYMEHCRDPLLQRIVHAAHSNSLHAVIITRQEEGIRPVEFSFHPEDRLSDIELLKLLDEMNRSNDKEHKALLIKSRLTSLHDYLDVFESGSLYGDEYESLFALFGDMELAILAKLVLYEELRDADTDIASIVLDSSGNEEEWKSCYIQYMQRVGSDRLQVIDELIHRIDYDDIKLA